MLAPLTPKAAGPVPLHILKELTVNVGGVFTVIVETAVFVQVPVAPITVYEVVVPGLPLTVAPLVALNPADQV